MTSKQGIRRWFAAAGVTTALLAGGCAGLMPKTEAYKVPPLGSTWTNAQANTGSYGTGTTRSTTTRGERVWQGRQALIFQTQAGSMVADPADGKWIALLAPNESIVATWDPPLGYEYPLFVGKTWVSRHRITNRATGRVADFEANFKVEAFEDVTVPAGTFRAYRIRYTDTMGNEDMQWASPDLGIFVKTSQKRSASHPQGAGTRETELVSQTIRK